MLAAFGQTGTRAGNLAANLRRVEHGEARDRGGGGGGERGSDWKYFEVVVAEGFKVLIFFFILKLKVQQIKGKGGGS